MLPHGQPAPGLFARSELFKRSASPERFVFPLLRDHTARAEPQREPGCSCHTSTASTRARGLPATPAAARRRGRGRREQHQGWASCTPRTPSPSTAPAQPRCRGLPSHPTAPGNPYLGVQGAQQRVQLHVQAAAADVDGSFQDLAEALHSERPGCSQCWGRGGPRRCTPAHREPATLPTGTARCQHPRATRIGSGTGPRQQHRAPSPHLGYVEGLRVLLVEGEDARDELRELLLQLLAGHQVAHGSHGLHHRQSQLQGDTKC